MRRLFSNRNFLLLWSGQLVSSIGTALHDLAMAWFVYELTGSTLATGASIISSFLPRALFSPLAGIISDKYNRKWVIVLSDVASGGAVLCMYALARADALTLPAILGFTALLSISSAFLGPAASAAIQSVVDEGDYQTANSLRQLRWRFATVVGAFLGGMLLRIVGIRMLLLINSTSFLLSALAETFIRLPAAHSPPADEPDSTKEGLLPIMRFLRANRQLLYMLILVMVVANGLFMCLFVYMPSLFMDVLGASSAEMGTYYALEAAAASVTAMVLIRRKISKPFLWVTMMLAAEGLILLAHGLIKTHIAAYGLALALGVTTTICVVLVMTIEQTSVPNNLMGRFTSFAALLGDGSMPIFTLMFGILGLTLPIRTVVVYSGILFLVALLPAPWIFADQIGLRTRRIQAEVVKAPR